MFGVILICLASLGYLALGARYLRATGPLVHHAAILSHDGVEVEEGHNGAFVAVYQISGSVMIAFAMMLIGLAIFPIYHDETWANVLIFLVCGVMTYGACLLPFRIEQRTGVRMAWRPAAVVNVMLLLGILFS